MAKQKKPITFDKILEELKKLDQKVFDAWEYCLEEQFNPQIDEDTRVWLQCDKGRYSHIIDELENIIATLEKWLMI